jgi:hypothetical protein
MATWKTGYKKELDSLVKDWMGESKEKKMNNFEIALKWMKEGKKVYNTEWPNDSKCDFFYIYSTSEKNEFYGRFKNSKDDIRIGIAPNDFTKGEWKIYDEYSDILYDLAINLIKIKNEYLHDHKGVTPEHHKAYDALIILKNDYIHISKAKIAFLDSLQPDLIWVKKLFYDIIEGKDIWFPVDEKKRR